MSLLGQNGSGGLTAIIRQLPAVVFCPKADQPMLVRISSLPETFATLCWLAAPLQAAFSGLAAAAAPSHSVSRQSCFFLWRQAPCVIFEPDLDEFANLTKTPMDALAQQAAMCHKPPHSKACCGSSVVEHIIGNDEVGSSILPRSTIS